VSAVFVEFFVFVVFVELKGCRLNEYRLTILDSAGLLFHIRQIESSKV